MPETTDAKALQPQNPDEGVVLKFPVWKSTLAQVQAAVPERLKAAFDSEVPPQRPDLGSERIPKKQKEPQVPQIVTASRSNYYSDSLAYSRIGLTYTPANDLMLIRETLLIVTPNKQFPEGSVVITKFTQGMPGGRELKSDGEGFDEEKNKLLARVKDSLS
jgi:hypothetical protein